MRKHYILMVTTAILSFAFCESARAEITKNDIMQNWWGNRSSYNGERNYQNDDGKNAGFAAHFGVNDELPWFGPTLTGHGVVGGWSYANITINGSAAFENSTGRTNLTTYDFDENGKLQAFYASANNGGQLLESYRYAEDGQLLVYNPQGQLIGAYDNYGDRYIAKFPYYDKSAELKHLDTDGNYTVKDGNNNVTGVYYQDGKMGKYKYNAGGQLLSANTYDAEGNVVGSYNYTYDAGGNLVSAYKNGKAVYLRKRYTIPEADAATQGKGPFRLDITW